MPKLLHPLILADQQIFTDYLARAHRHLQFQTDFVALPSAYAFASHYIWRDFFDFYWAIWDGYFCLFAKQAEDYFMPIAPFGDDSYPKVKNGTDTENFVSVLDRAFNFMLSQSQRPHIIRIENMPIQLCSLLSEAGINSTSASKRFHTAETETEFIYCRQKLVDLRGNTYKSKRHAINTFKADHPLAEVSPYSPNKAEDCLRLYQQWSTSRTETFPDQVYCALLEDSSFAHRTGLQMADKINLFGLVVKIDCRICAYTLGYALGADTFCVLFEVADLRYPGLAQFIFHQLCIQRTEKWINVMGDSGLQNLKRVKMSYRPSRLEKCFALRLTNDA